MYNEINLLGIRDNFTQTRDPLDRSFLEHSKPVLHENMLFMCTNEEKNRFVGFFFYIGFGLDSK